MFNLIEFIYDYVRMILSVKVFMNGVTRIWFYIFRLREILNIYFIFTSGGYSGIAGYLTKRMAKAKKMIYMGHADFKMPRNYPVSRRYPLLSDEENKKRLKDSYMKIPSVAARIKRGEKLKSRYITQFEKIITLPFNPVWVKKMHVTEPFCTTDKCIGCG